MTKMIPRHLSPPNHGYQDEVLPPYDLPSTHRLYPLSKARDQLSTKCARRWRGSGQPCSQSFVTLRVDTGKRALLRLPFVSPAFLWRS